MAASYSKDLTSQVIMITNKVFENMLSFQNKIPYAISAVLRIIIANAKGLSDLNKQIQLQTSDVYLLSELLISGWLNTGARNPKCFGV